MTGDVISLFAGVGCTDYALENAGWSTCAIAESDPWCRDILRKRFPEAVHYDDVRSVRHETWTMPGGTELFERPLMVVGGFPCQDVSGSGTGFGITGARSSLVFEQLRVIREFQPDYALFENAPQLTMRGLSQIVAKLVALGYYVRWECLTAGTVDAPHLRDRCWIMARKRPWDSIDFTADDRIGDDTGLPPRLPRAGYAFPSQWGTTFAVATKPLDTKRTGRLNAEAVHGRLLPTPTKSDGSGGPGTSPKRTGGKNLRTVIAEMDGNGRLDPAYLEWMMGLPFGWTDPDVTIAGRDFDPPMSWRDPRVGLLQRTLGYNVKHRSKRIQAIGNGLVPAVADLAIDLLTAP